MDGDLQTVDLFGHSQRKSQTIEMTFDRTGAAAETPRSPTESYLSSSDDEAVHSSTRKALLHSHATHTPSHSNELVDLSISRQHSSLFDADIDLDSLTPWQRWKRNVGIIVFAQLLSVVQSVQYVLRAELVKNDWDAPALMNAGIYLVLFLITYLRLVANTCNEISDDSSHANSLLNDSANENSDSIGVGHIQHGHHRGHGTRGDVETASGPRTSSGSSTSSGPGSLVNAAGVNTHNRVSVFDSSTFSIGNNDDLNLWEILRTSFLPISGRLYILAAVADVEGNALMLLAYQFTSITSTTLLDFFNIPVVIVLGYMFFGRSTDAKQISAIGVALIGLSLLIEDDKQSGHDKSAHRGKNPVLGDGMMLVGATFVGVAYVLEEYLVKAHSSPLHFLHNIGIYGFLVSAIQGFVFERHIFAQKAKLNTETMCFYVGFLVTSVCYYVLVPVFLNFSNATMMNLSLLTSDLYTIAAGLLLFHIKLHPLYFLSVACVITGVVSFNVFEKQHDERLKREAMHERMAELSIDTESFGALTESSTEEQDSEEVEEEEEEEETGFGEGSEKEPETEVASLRAKRRSAKGIHFTDDIKDETAADFEAIRLEPPSEKRTSESPKGLSMLLGNGPTALEMASVMNNVPQSAPRRDSSQSQRSSEFVKIEEEKTDF